MIKFFRRIRHSLIIENKTGRYLKYAIGEIILVVIGILIALSINNWNEGRKESRAASSFLLGIKQDLKADSLFIEKLIPEYLGRQTKFQHFTSLTQKKVGKDSLNYDKIIELIIPQSTFFGKVGSYNAMISEGRTTIIKNKGLLNIVQGLYEIEYKRLEKFGDRVDAASDKVLWETRQTRLDNITNFDAASASELTSEIDHIYGINNAYFFQLQQLKIKIGACIDAIRKELKKNP
jgi:hypothetical protein